MTNLEKIRTMSADEFADMICKYDDTRMCNYCMLRDTRCAETAVPHYDDEPPELFCRNSIVKWLQSEVYERGYTHD